MGYWDEMYEKGENKVIDKLLMENARLKHKVKKQKKKIKRLLNHIFDLMDKISDGAKEQTNGDLRV